MFRSHGSNYIRWILCVCGLFFSVFSTSGFARQQADDQSSGGNDPWATRRDGVHALGLTWLPYAEGIWVYDRNPRLIEQGREEDDHYRDLVAGLNVRRDTERVRVLGASFVRDRRYADFGDLDHYDWALRGNLEVGGRDANAWSLRAHGLYGRLVDYAYEQNVVESLSHLEGLQAGETELLNRANRVERRQAGWGAGVNGTLGHKTWLTVDVAQSRTRYVDPVWNNKQENFFKLGVARDVTDKSALTLGAELMQTDDESYVRTLPTYAVRGGWDLKGADKTTLHAAAGYWWTESPDAALARQGLSYEVGAVWQPTRRITLWATGRNEVQSVPDSDDNSRLVNLGWLASRYQASRRTTVSLVAGIRDEDYSRPYDEAGEVIDRAVRQLFYRLNAQYRLFRNSRLFAAGSFEDTRDNFRGDYEQLRLQVGARVAF